MRVAGLGSASRRSQALRTACWPEARPSGPASETELCLWLPVRSDVHPGEETTERNWPWIFHNFNTQLPTPGAGRQGQAGQRGSRQHQEGLSLLSSRSVVSESCLTPRTAARQAPLSLGLSRQEDWGGLLCPSSRGSSQPRDQTRVSCIAGGFFTTEPPGMPTKRADDNKQQRPIHPVFSGRFSHVEKRE